MNERLTGTVVRLLPDKGFGFLQTAEGHEWFFHRSAVEDFMGLVIGEVMSFDPLKDAPKGPRAERLERV